ncbi:hypothetical protein DY000_02031004 [Brassica cretica]|uniref:Uncharacterized protein n=1 Tax=Brassica cretica TaxID=69181 RepID=A0ABQ7DT29_BRACR|nr:hypothetical protein DY000_02031004 [Brassica cretica]
MLPTQTGLVNNETGEPVVPIIPTEVHVDDVNNQQELRNEEGAESSHAGERAGLNTGAEELIEPSMKDVSHGGDQKRKRDQVEEGKTSSGRPECPKCGRYHGGECWKATGACTRCDNVQVHPNQMDARGKDKDACGTVRMVRRMRMHVCLRFLHDPS